MEGFEDPFCRACYPWGREDEELQAYYRMMTALRGSSEALRRGGLRVLAAGNGRIAFSRAFGDESLDRMREPFHRGVGLPAGRVRFAESAAPSPSGRGRPDARRLLPAGTVGSRSAYLYRVEISPGDIPNDTKGAIP